MQWKGVVRGPWVWLCCWEARFQMDIHLVEPCPGGLCCALASRPDCAPIRTPVQQIGTQCDVRRRVNKALSQ